MPSDASRRSSFDSTDVAAAASGRWAWAEIDVDALAHNVRSVASAVSPSGVRAVVKADGYGHGAVTAAHAALGAGAAGLCVALVHEGVELRSAGVDAPILVLTEQPAEQLETLALAGLEATAYRRDHVGALADAAARAGVVVPVHLKVDSGMQRVGAPPEQLAPLVEAVRATDSLRLAGVFTHLAVADEPAHGATGQQLARFDEALDTLDTLDSPDAPAIHIANSAGALGVPAARRSFVRLGIALYGISPGPDVDHLVADLRPALSLKAKVSYVKPVAAGTHVSYGWRHRFEHDTTVATVPIGYADGVPRRLGTLPDAPGADVLVGGRRCPIVGVVTMDQLVVDLGDTPAEIGDEVVLIGRQGEHEIRAEHWAERLGTIGYEIVCGISARVPRRVIGGPVSMPSTPHRPPTP